MVSVSYTVNSKRTRQTTPNYAPSEYPQIVAMLNS